MTNSPGGSSPLLAILRFDRRSRRRQREPLGPVGKSLYIISKTAKSALQAPSRITMPLEPGRTIHIKV
jgi:hypothetical protein